MQKLILFIAKVYAISIILCSDVYFKVTITIFCKHNILLPLKLYGLPLITNVAHNNSGWIMYSTVFACMVRQFLAAVQSLIFLFKL